MLLSSVHAVGRPPKTAGSTPERIVATAERLFAERGIEAVSLRDITNSCGANSAAIHYHFGSKERLLRAILEHRAAELAKRRDAHLTVIEQSRRPTLRQVVEALVVPTADLVHDDAHGGRYYVGFLAAMLERDDSAVDAEAVTAELVLQLERSLRRMPEDDCA